jgi:hypothetical protein
MKQQDQRCVRTRLAVVGVLTGLFGVAVGVGMAGSGHGWVSAFFASLILPLTYPLALWRWGSIRDLKLDAVLLVAALVADGWLMHMTLNEGDYYIMMWNSAPILTVVWLSFWFGWQTFAVLCCVLQR